MLHGMQDVAAFYQSLSWVTYTVGAILSAYTTGVTHTALNRAALCSLIEISLVVLVVHDTPAAQFQQYAA
jgi:3-polyprenyl-4-hydroxybenzoate decarboxylase